MKMICLLYAFCSLMLACQTGKTSTSEAELNAQVKQTLPVEAQFYAIRKFVDGDTFWIDDSSATGIKVRLIGMDTPESRNVFKKKKHPMGKEVSAYVKNLLQGKRVRLELDVEQRDQYGRILAYVFLEDGTHLNELLLKMGYALLMTTPPNVKYVDAFVKAQTEAREQSKGLWGMPAE